MTKVYCEKCASIRDCKALFPKQAGAPSSGRFWYRDYGEKSRVYYLKRGRQCSSCGRTWLTVEIDEDILKKIERLIEENKRLEIESSRMSAKLEGISRILKAKGD